VTQLHSIAVALGLALVGVAPTLADAPTSAGRCPIDQSFESDNIHIDSPWIPYAFRSNGAVAGVGLAQSLTVGRTGTLSDVSIRISGTDLTGDLPLEIRRGAPDGPLLASATMAEADVATPGWLDVPLEPAPGVHRGQVIVIVLPALEPRYNADIVTRQPYIEWVSSFEDLVGNSFVGDRSRRDPGIDRWELSGVGRHFRTYVCAMPPTDTVAESPTPAASRLSPIGWLFVFGSGAAGLLLALRRRAARA
jgi:hypothetical protein